ncbi:hypothetical protein O0L34_g4194 [Tuta absoluta]|nr:hypothetical protein O0L34_g4194 [Tuta absoluta]
MRLPLVLLWLGAAAACGPGRGFTRRNSPRRVTPLVFGQHDPNVSENSLAASGPAEGRITRNDEKFRDLVPNYNEDIDFKDDEGTGADRLMTQRCKERLNTLAISVMNQWPGVRLRVIEGWDEENAHLEHSLHYEGRAVDLTTSDKDRSKNGMLARLAREAGFDWVFYESRSYIHCSVKSDRSKNGMLARPASEASFNCVFYESRSYIHCSVKSGMQPLLLYHTFSIDRSKNGMLARLAREAGFDWVFYESRSYIHCSVKSESSVGTGAGCFPSGAMVHTEQGPRDIASLQVGDRVLAADDTGKLVYSEVLTFLDRDPNATRAFVQVTAQNGVTITTTPSHLLLLAAADGFREVFAANIQVGDTLLTHGPGSVMRPSRVVRSKMVTRLGVYAPLTTTGTIMVDDALASCYALVRSQKLAHTAMAPLRWLSRWSSSAPGADLPRGVHWYASALYKFGDYVLPTSYRFQ